MFPSQNPTCKQIIRHLVYELPQLYNVWCTLHTFILHFDIDDVLEIERLR